MPMGISFNACSGATRIATDSGRLEVKRSQANTYMKLAANYNRERNLLEAPSIRAALELLSEKEPEAVSMHVLAQLALQLNHARFKRAWAKRFQCMFWRNSHCNSLNFTCPES